MKTAMKMEAALGAAKTEADRADLNDWAVNTVRANWPEHRAVQADMVRKEVAHCEGKTLMEYVRCNRAGAKYRLNRATRVGVYVLLATRGLL